MLNKERSPFTREELERYRSRISEDMLADDEEAVFTDEHYRVYLEILDRLPTTWDDSGKSILTDCEKQIVKDELDRIKRGPRLQVLDKDGDSSLSMIHMIFCFFLQSAQY